MVDPQQLPHWFDTTIHFGDVMTTGLLTAIGYGLRRFYMLIANFIAKVDSVDRRLEASNEVIDEHSAVLEKHGFVMKDFSRVSKKRRADDHYVRVGNETEEGLTP